jgi:hypothetical protein
MAQVDFDNTGDAVKKDDRDPFKFMERTTSRFCIVDKSVEYEETHFDGGHHICTMKTEGHCLWCEEKKDEPRARFANNIFIYQTLPDGNPIAGAPMTGRFEWIAYSKDRFFFLKSAKEQFGDLREHDILFACEDTKYQKGQMQVLPIAWWRQDANFVKWFVEQYKQRAIKNLSAKLGKHVPYVQQREYMMRQMQRNSQRGGQPGFDPRGTAMSAAQRAGQSGGYPGGMPSFGGQPPTSGGFGGPPAGSPGMDSLFDGTPAAVHPPALPPADSPVVHQPPSAPLAQPDAYIPSPVAAAAPTDLGDLDNILAQHGKV